MDSDRLMALIEWADSVAHCSRLVICVERSIDAGDRNGLLRDLGWVGFELTTLEPWTRGYCETSTRWLMMVMEM